MEFESEILPAGNPDSGKKQHALGSVENQDTPLRLGVIQAFDG
jgi:hypothetical protein